MFNAMGPVIPIVLLASAIGWLFNTPVPPGFKDPWELRKFMAKERILSIVPAIESCFSTPEDILKSRRDTARPGPDPKINEYKVKREDLVFDGVNVRLYTPEGLEGDSSPAIVFYHGGGWMLGSVETYDHFTSSFAHHTKAKLVSVDYRRSPEHHYPTPLEDCVRATVFFFEHCREFGVNQDRIAIAGDSAGGNLAAAATLKLRDIGIQPQPKLQVLVVPMLQAINFKSSSFLTFENDPLLPKYIIASSWHMYATGDTKYLKQFMENDHVTSEIKNKLYNKQLNPRIISENLADEGGPFEKENIDTGDAEIWNELKDILMDPYFAPLMSKDLSGLPDTLVITAGQDVLRNDGIWYAKYMETFGVKVKHYHYRSGYHAVITWPVIYQDNVYESRKILFDLVKERL